MAANKKSFILYCDLVHTVRKMSKEKAGELFLTILGYVNDENPVIEDPVVDLVFEPIKQQLKRDLKRWDIYIKKQSHNGSLGGRPSKAKKAKPFLEKPKKPSKAKKADNVNDNVNVNDRENTGAPRGLSNSNLYRKPKIPRYEEVVQYFKSAGGTQGMADSFFAKHEATGWFLNNSPIVNWKALAGRFISNWNDNSNGKVDLTGLDKSNKNFFL